MKNEESLDPQNWNEIRQLGHQMLDDMFDFMMNVQENPVWQIIPAEVKQEFQKSAPFQPQNEREVYDEFKKFIKPYLKGNHHPRFWGWVEGTGTPFGMLAEMLAGGLNANVNFGEQSPVYVELQVIEWFKEIFSFPKEASGILVGGGSVANFVGLAVARNAKAGFDVKDGGLQNVSNKLRLYGSSEMHNSIQKAVELLGLGNNALRRIPVEEDFRINIIELKKAIETDRRDGFQPFCVIGNVGTVNTGAIDDIDKLANICQAENLWLHLDGAFGLLAILAPQMKLLLKSVAKADSLAFDLHKWMYIQYEAGCVLVRDAKAHRQTFMTPGSYLAQTARGVANGPLWFGEFGPQLSRGFNALKIWMSIKQNGIDKYSRLIQQNIEQAQYLQNLIKANIELQLIAPVSLNIVCFRFIKDGLSEIELNQLNEEILLQLQEKGIAVPSYTKIKGLFVVRVAITNHRSRKQDFDELVQNILVLGQNLIK